ncbi:sugar-phosphate isomerase, RpiB/LacA/LacB family [Emticicia oligotrophica DSM 17448]|uniref:Sugar-phosphate isomerase, RpiB/LacA/LacB family n=1 Tax=Emticicia oligotrophica (strain DSM 17448 / CIP 109782 / MTCC 6937 / GPTSA100-15) TaxID=929562 RepID=A0ABN4AT60_EMTOG|nr:MULTISPECIES: ribose 5-phosphate isomerase B [Emticicia]AFK04892.1 sugar-phosphate isomerase, RpiB/LacA/LacB family [Emticicia oligotrophica DSM 17448]
MKVAIAGDHAGFEYKKIILRYLQEQNYQTADFGPYTDESMDYPDTAHQLSSAVESGEYEFGILICGSGNGVCMTANHHKGIRAGLAWNVEVAALIRQHNNANVICLPARFIDENLALDCVKTFLSTEFEGGRHARRADKISC